MKKNITLIFIVLLFVGSILCAGCNTYAEPELILNSTLQKVHVSPETQEITYDVTVDVTNKGGNNAYDVSVMVIVSTPKDLPEYRFVNDNFEVGTVPKQETISVSRQVTLQMTDSNFDLLSKGTRDAEIEAKVTRVTSNIMG